MARIFPPTLSVMRGMYGPVSVITSFPRVGTESGGMVMYGWHAVRVVIAWLIHLMGSLGLDWEPPFSVLAGFLSYGTEPIG